MKGEETFKRLDPPRPLETQVTRQLLRSVAHSLYEGAVSGTAGHSASLSDSKGVVGITI